MPVQWLLSLSHNLSSARNIAPFYNLDSTNLECLSPKFVQMQNNGFGNLAVFVAAWISKYTLIVGQLTGWPIGCQDLAVLHDLLWLLSAACTLWGIRVSSQRWRWQCAGQPPKTVHTYINPLRSQGRYEHSWDEFRDFPRSESGIRTQMTGLQASRAFVITQHCILFSVNEIFSRSEVVTSLGWASAPFNVWPLRVSAPSGNRAVCHHRKGWGPPLYSVGLWTWSCFASEPPPVCKMPMVGPPWRLSYLFMNLFVYLLVFILAYVFHTTSASFILITCFPLTPKCPPPGEHQCAF